MPLALGGGITVNSQRVPSQGFLEWLDNLAHLPLRRLNIMSVYPLPLGTRSDISEDRYVGTGFFQPSSSTYSLPGFSGMKGWLNGYARRSALLCLLGSRCERAPFLSEEHRELRELQSTPRRKRVHMLKDLTWPIISRSSP